MKRIFFLLFSIVSTLAAAQKTIGIATFDIAGNALSKDEADIITELYITELAKTGWTVMPNRAKFTKVLNDLKFQASDWSDASKTTKLANAMNVDVISTGKIMKLGSKLYIVATLIDAKTACVLSTSKMEAGSVGDIPNILNKFVADLKTCYSPSKIKGGWYIGATGPGGGMVFNIEGNIAWEVSEWLDRGTWYDALKICKEYRGGGYSDWYLPSYEELELIDKNLVNKGKLETYSHHWTSLHSGVDDDGDDRAQDYLLAPCFSEWGGCGNASDIHSIRAVRSFDILATRAKMNIGHTGPGGGTIFYIKGDKMWEVSERLGSASWDDAKTRCQQYHGGGYDDWYLPTEEELNLIYENLIKTEILEDCGEYWSSSLFYYGNVVCDHDVAWLQFFYEDDEGDNDSFYYYKVSERGVRAVRTFTVSDR